MPAKGSGTNSRVSYNCSFCGKSQEEVQRMLSGAGGGYICGECVSVCNLILEESKDIDAC